MEVNYNHKNLIKGGSTCWWIQSFKYLCICESINKSFQSSLFNLTLHSMYNYYVEEFWQDFCVCSTDWKILYINNIPIQDDDPTSHLVNSQRVTPLYKCKTILHFWYRRFLLQRVQPFFEWTVGRVSPPLLYPMYMYMYMVPNPLII